MRVGNVSFLCFDESGKGCEFNGRIGEKRKNISKRVSSEINEGWLIGARGKTFSKWDKIKSPGRVGIERDIMT